MLDIFSTTLTSVLNHYITESPTRTNKSPGVLHIVFNKVRIAVPHAGEGGRYHAHGVRGDVKDSTVVEWWWNGGGGGLSPVIHRCGETDSISPGWWNGGGKGGGMVVEWWGRNAWWWNGGVMVGDKFCHR